MLLAGLAFKASAAPFHMWTPDVYQGAPTSVVSFMAAATKIAALTVMYRVLVTAFPEQSEIWTVAVAVVAVASLAVGNLAALAQQDVKRLLAYSSVSHAGFMLIAVAANSELGARALLFYLIPYSATALGAFAVIAARERELGRAVSLRDLEGYGWERPFHGFAMWVFMLGAAGFPLTGGLIGKLYVFSAAYEAGWWWLVVIGVDRDGRQPRVLPGRRARDVHAPRRRPPQARHRRRRRLATRRSGAGDCRSARASRSRSAPSSSSSR